MLSIQFGVRNFTAFTPDLLSSTDALQAPDAGKTSTCVCVCERAGAGCCAAQANTPRALARYTGFVVGNGAAH